MGTVYVGFDAALQRKVAVKVVRGEFRMDAEARARFLREARILSQVDHPAVCKVHDFIEAESDDYLILEYVSGRHLGKVIHTGLSRKECLSIAETLLDVLVAVHQKGVIHRDLKPENIMITAEGGIKVLDFGLARSLREKTVVSQLETELRSDVAPETETTSPHVKNFSGSIQTQIGMIVGTIGYMSPEQARGEPATAASDMYSVGLILQELFAGVRPFDTTLPAVEILQRTRDGKTKPVECADADIKNLIERLKATAPGARPSSADALATIQRIINKPRQRRIRRIVAAIWSILAILSIGLAIQSVRATKAAERAKREARRAEIQREAAKQVSTFLIDIFHLSDPDNSKGASVTARELLDASAENLQEELKDQPQIRARLLSVIGQVYGDLGLLDQSAELLEQALSIQDRYPDTDRRQLISTLLRLGQTDSTLDRYDKAEQLYKRSIKIASESLERTDQLFIQCKEHLADLLRDQGRYRSSESLYSECLDLAGKIEEPDSLFIAHIENNFAHLYILQGRFSEAERFLRHALYVREHKLGKEHVDVSWTLNSFGWNLVELGQYHEAEELLLRTLKIREKKLGPDHIYIATVCNNLGGLYRRMGHFDEAESYFRRALKILHARYGPEHHYTAKCSANLAVVLTQTGRTAEAKRLLEQALAFQREHLEEDDPDTADTLSHLAELAAIEGNHKKAGALYDQAILLLSKSKGREHPHLVPVLIARGDLELSQGQTEEAGMDFQKALDIANKTLGVSHPLTSLAREDLEKISN